MTTLEWIQKGNTGCTFATLFSKRPELVGWKFYDKEEWMIQRLFGVIDASVVSINFPPDWDKERVYLWARRVGMSAEFPAKGCIGLRVECKQGTAWVQYFGPDSHVVTRRAPNPTLTYTNKVGLEYYAKVGFKGVLHLAHAWRKGMSQKIADLLWDRSHKQTKKLIGHELTVVEAAKTTFYESL